MKEHYFSEIVANDIIAPDGTRLAAALQPEDAALLGASSGRESFAPVFIAGQCTSTFDLAWNFLRKRNLPPWSAVLALGQSRGRGQLRREWVSPPGNLYVSFFLPRQIAELDAMASLATGYCIHAALGRMKIVTRIKWPNDLLLHGPHGAEGKFGGLLLEEREGRLLAGLGLNLLSAPDDYALREGRSVPAMALSACGMTVFDFWLSLAQHMWYVFDRELAGMSLETIRQKVEGALTWMGRRVHAEEAGVSGELAGLNADGSLCLRTVSGMVAVSSGSVISE